MIFAIVSLCVLAASATATEDKKLEARGAELYGPYEHVRYEYAPYGYDYNRYNGYNRYNHGHYSNGYYVARDNHALVARNTGANADSVAFAGREGYGPGKHVEGAVHAVSGGNSFAASGVEHNGHFSGAVQEVHGENGPYGSSYSNVYGPSYAGYNGYAPGYNAGNYVRY